MSTKGSHCVITLGSVYDCHLCKWDNVKHITTTENTLSSNDKTEKHTARQEHNRFSGGDNEKLYSLSGNCEMAVLQVQMRSLQSFWKQRRCRSVWLCINCFCSYGSQERFRQIGRRPWSYRCTRGKAQEPSAAVTGQSHCCQCRARSLPTCF